MKFAAILAASLLALAALAACGPTITPGTEDKELNLVEVEGVRCVIAREGYHGYINALSCDWGRRD